MNRRSFFASRVAVAAAAAVKAASHRLFSLISRLRIVSRAAHNSIHRYFPFIPA